jgi:hypothetical protein
MARKLALLAAGAFALLVAASAFDTAEARKGGGGGWGGGRGYHGGGHARAFSGHAFRGHAFRSHRFVRRGVIVGVPLAYGAYYYANSCSWLRHRALVTGSPYWWSRYNDCVYGYYY